MLTSGPGEAQWAQVTPSSLELPSSSWQFLAVPGSSRPFRQFEHCRRLRLLH